MPAISATSAVPGIAARRPRCRGIEMSPMQSLGRALVTKQKRSSANLDVDRRLEGHQLRARTSSSWWLPALAFPEVVSELASSPTRSRSWVAAHGRDRPSLLSRPSSVQPSHFGTHQAGAHSPRRGRRAVAVVRVFCRRCGCRGRDLPGPCPAESLSGSGSGTSPVLSGSGA